MLSLSDLLPRHDAVGDFLRIGDIRYVGGRYRLKGRFVSKPDALKLVRQHIADRAADMQAIAQRDNLTVQDIEREGAKLLKQIAIAQVVLGAGGFEKITEADLGRAGAFLKKQYYAGVDENGRKFGLRHLAREWLNGEVSTGQLRSRLGLYAAAPKQLYWQTWADRQPSGLYRRKLGVTDNHCQFCIAEAAKPPRTIDKIPMPGCCPQCLVNCKCSIVRASTITKAPQMAQTRKRDSLRLDVACGKGWQGTKGQCRRARRVAQMKAAKAVKGAATEIGQNTAAWAIGKTFGGIVGAAATAHGIDPDIGKVLGESAAQGLAMAAIEVGKNGKPHEYVRSFLANASAAVAGKLTAGFDDTALGVDPDVKEWVATLATKRSLDAVVNASARYSNAVSGMLDRLARNDVADDFAPLAMAIAAFYLSQIKQGTMFNRSDARQGLKGACWEGYEAIGFKRKGKKRVPNCVPVRRDSKSFTPPASVRKAARQALDVRKTKPESQRGMTPVGIARARDLANGKPLSLDTVKRMKSYFDRHAVDKQGQTWNDRGKGWQAWQGWGGDAGKAWANNVLSEEREDAWKRIGPNQRGQKCGRGWEGLKGACQRSKKGASETERKTARKLSAMALAQKIRAEKGMESVAAANVDRRARSVETKLKAAKRVEDMSLGELFREADRVGKKYQTGIPSIGERREAKAAAQKIMDETGMTRLKNKAMGVADISQGKKPKLSIVQGGAAKAVKAEVVQKTVKPKLADRIREQVKTLKEEQATSAKAMGRILTASAKIADNHDKLIGEVSELMQSDLDKKRKGKKPKPNKPRQIVQRKSMGDLSIADIDRETAANKQRLIDMYGKKRGEMEWARINMENAVDDDISIEDIDRENAKMEQSFGDVWGAPLPKPRRQARVKTTAKKRRKKTGPLPDYNGPQDGMNIQMGKLPSRGPRGRSIDSADHRQDAKKSAKQKKIAKIFKEWKAGELNIGKSDKMVPTSKKGRRQAIAIAISETRRAGR